MMRYSEIPHDFSSDSLHFAELGEDQIYRSLRDDSPPSDVSLHSVSGRPLVGTSSGAVGGSNNGGGATEKWKLSDKLSFRSNHSNGSAAAGDHHHLQEVIRHGRTKKNSLTGNSGSVTTSATTPSEQYMNHSLTSSKKSNSLPPNASIHDADAVIANVLRISPEELANQITLLDFPIFADIKPDELTSCAWTKKNKRIMTPNIVAFTKRFNQTTFWTVQEILGGNTPKIRAELMAHFIRVAKKLYELNNLHSLFAIISALQSASIFRLAKTWSCLSKKERATFDRLADIYNDKDNWSTLREYLESLKLPCIPYIGLYLTDLVYIDLAYPHKGGGLVEPEQRSIQMNNILRVIANYQNSDYGFIVVIPQIQKYLQPLRYVEELQNIFEEDQYKRSLKLEPPAKAVNGSSAGGGGGGGPSSSSCSSKESIVPGAGGGGGHHAYAVDPIALESLNLSPAKSVSSMRSSSSVSATSKFIPGHRKCRSLGTKCRSTSLPRSFHHPKCVCGGGNTTATTTSASANVMMVGNGGSARTLPGGNRCKCRIFKTQVGVMNGNGGNYHHNNTATNASALLAGTDLNNDSGLHHSRHLLDDSVLEDSKNLGRTDSISTGSSDGILGYDHRQAETFDRAAPRGDVLEFQGCVHRKTLLKDGRKPAVASWQRYWLQVWAKNLVYFSPKTFKGNERTDFKREPSKVCSLEGWHVEQDMDKVGHANTFHLVNMTIRTVYKFRTSNAKMARFLADVLHHIVTTQRTEQSLPVNLMSFE